MKAWVRIPEMGTFFSMETFLSRGPAGEATAAGDDEEKERDISPDRAPLESGRRGLRPHSPTWETVQKVVNHGKTDDRSYADVCRAGFEQGSLSKLRRRHFAKQSKKTPKEQQVQVQESVRVQSNHC